jgi:hypothetical protein
MSNNKLGGGGEAEPYLPTNKNELYEWALVWLTYEQRTESSLK